MSLEEVMCSVIEGENVTELKKEFCKKLEELDNETFMELFDALVHIAFNNDDECCCEDCDCGCGCGCCDDCDCDDCDCDDCDCEDCDC